LGGGKIRHRTSRSTLLRPFIAGLDPAIHLYAKKKLDPRVKPAGDEQNAASTSLAL
jgi:hypothetical protein